LLLLLALLLLHTACRSIDSSCLFIYEEDLANMVDFMLIEKSTSFLDWHILLTMPDASVSVGGSLAGLVLFPCEEEEGVVKVDL
jgi:hypothetical protein